MIDYDKLEQAWRLMGEVLRENELRKLDEKVKELIKPEPKYKLGDKVWVRDYEFGPVQTTICEIDTASKEMYYENEYQDWRTEDELYPSREALIEHQVHYWLSLLEMPEQIRYFAKQAKPMSCTENPKKSTHDDIHVECGEYYK